MKQLDSKKIISVFWKIINFFEVIMAAVVFVAVIVSIVDSVPAFMDIWSSKMGMEGLNKVIERIFSVVIAVEFLKMLLKPTSKTVIEVLVFLIARHMIAQNTSVYEDLVSVISICLLFVLQMFLKKFSKDKPEDKE